MITVNSVQISTPSKFDVAVQDITKAWRDNRGKMHFEYIATKRKIELQWNYLTSAQLATLFQAVQGTSSTMFFSVQYPDPQTGALRTGTFYVGDRSTGSIDYLGGVMRYRDIKFNFIEQ